MGIAEEPRAAEIELSVVLSTYNRADRLQVCLEALAHQTVAGRDFEVVVVIDGSTDGTEQVLANLAAPYRLAVLKQENQGQCRALNRGIAAARGRICLIIDDDVIAGSTLIEEHVRLHRDQANVVGVGQLALRLPDDADWFAHCFARGWAEQYARLNERVSPPGWQDCYGGNMSVQRSTLLAVGGFATNLPRNYDIELAYRLQERGLAFVYLQNAVGVQDERKGWRELALDSERGGKANVIICQQEPRLASELLGSFNEASCRKVLLRRVLLRLRVPAKLLVAVGAIFERWGRGYSWYSFVQNYCYWRGVQRALANGETWRRLTRGVPVLMYHAFAENGEHPSRFVVTVRQFERQLAALKRFGYRVLSLREFLELRRQHQLPPERSVIITFDDGYRDNLHVAALLRRYESPAVIFLVTAHIGCSNRWDRTGSLARRPLLSWDQIRELAADGVEVGAHSKTHPVLTSLPAQRVEEELVDSKLAVEAAVDAPVAAFAYPYGEYDPTLYSVLSRAGFEMAFTVDEGLNSPGTPLYALRRIEIPGTTSLWRFFFALRFGRLKL